MRTRSMDARRPTHAACAAWTPCGRSVDAGRGSESHPRRACALGSTLLGEETRDEVVDEETPQRRFPPGQPLAGGAATIVCNGSGGYRVAMNDWAGATCGIEACVRKHEESHASDWKGRWPDGCKDKADGAQIPLGGAGYPAFLKASECTAYGVEETCISPKAAAAATGKTACEVTLRDHLADTRTQKATFC